MDGLHELFEPGIRRTFRAMAVDRFRNRTMPRQAELLFEPESGPWSSDRDFLSEFHNEIHHQDTCDQSTADGVPLLVAPAVDDRVPAGPGADGPAHGTLRQRHRGRPPPGTVPTRHAPAGRPCGRGPGQASGPRAPRRGTRPLGRGASTALRRRVEVLADERREEASITRYLRFVMLVTGGTDRQTRPAVESLAASHWQASHHEAPVRARAVHLLDQMLSQVRALLLVRLP